jgi:hypothetical protein
MMASLAVAAAALRAGLRLRRARQRGERHRPGDRRRHLRLAKTALVLLSVGFVAGPASAVWLRGWDPFSTLHAWAALLALTLFAATGWLGRQLERGALARRELHAALGLLAVLVAVAALLTGLVLLP